MLWTWPAGGGRPAPAAVGAETGHAAAGAVQGAWLALHSALPWADRCQVAVMELAVLCAVTCHIHYSCRQQLDVDAMFAAPSSAGPAAAGHAGSDRQRARQAAASRRRRQQQPAEAAVSLQAGTCGGAAAAAAAVVSQRQGAWAAPKQARRQRHEVGRPGSIQPPGLGVSGFPALGHGCSLGLGLRRLPHASIPAVRLSRQQPSPPGQRWRPQRARRAAGAAGRQPGRRYPPAAGRRLRSQPPV